MKNSLNASNLTSKASINDGLTAKAVSSPKINIDFSIIREVGNVFMTATSVQVNHSAKCGSDRYIK